MSLRLEAQSPIFSEEGTQNTFARTHPQRHSSNVMAYVPPETSKTSGIKTLPEDLHLGGNMTREHSTVFPNYLKKFLYLTLAFCFFPSPQFRALQPSSTAAVLSPSHSTFWKFYWHCFGKNQRIIWALFRIILKNPFNTYSCNTCTSYTQLLSKISQRL